MFLRLALLLGWPAASFSTPLLYFSGLITTPGVFRMLGRVISLSAQMPYSADRPK